ncbi:hypothetical protein MUK70_23705 [Dyadobacter chenwenxiniae]|uniref:Uncharacterized protein n=1 Tax=Dyadobacter chenwenxiniae TaxID=2906456 RepID=A0A9X1TI20_9BACT|nr:hypothetical protein [Dyadobacter chenwenxiniae]MCF0065712.1 hypothetical protein [Dyadobacter chenwenxiniae]UON82045.1 hypothetical protein MUK70_23705 [Dyadobacter chenwenxiniae]
MSLSWKSNISGTECRIFRGKLIVGILKTNFWKSTGYGELNGYLLRFKNKGLFNTITKILDIDGTKVLGEIKYNVWSDSATITYEDGLYEWKYESWTRKKWIVKTAEDAAEFTLTSFWKDEGNVDNESVSPPIILAALYVSSHLRTIMSAA